MRSPLQYISTALVVGVCSVAAWAQSDPERLNQLERSSAAATTDRAQQLELARLYVTAGRYYEASRLTELMLAADPNDAEATKLHDEAATGLKNVQEQKIAEADAMAARSDLSDADRLVMADRYFEGGRYLSAAAAYAKLPESMRTREVKLREARALAWAGRLDQAERLYAGLTTDASDPALELEYGRLLSWMGASRPATQHLQAAYDKQQDEASLVALANAKSWSGDREGALQLLSTYIAQHPDATAAARLRDEISTGPDLRIEKLDRIIAVEPYNLALRVERARLLVQAKRYNEALQAIDFIEDHSSAKLEGIAELKAEATRGRSEQIAELEKRRQQLAGRTAQTPEEMKKLAGDYIGVGDNDRAIELYAKYLAAQPDDTEARVKYARALNWDGRYDAAEREYARLIAANPDRADLRYEYAQVLSYEEEYVPAMRTFRALTDVGNLPRPHLYADVPEKAHFNLGQIYRWFGWNEHAIAEQQSAIGLDATYTPARTELDLVRHLRPATHLDGTYTFSEDSNDFTMRRYDLTAEKWTSQRTGWDVLLGRHNFERGGDDVEANAFAVGGRYRWEDRLTARGRVGLNNYTNDLGTRPYWALGAQWLPSIQSLFSLDYNHYDLVYDVFTLESLNAGNRPLDIDDFRAHYDYKTGGHLAYLADASYGFVSDDNNRFSAHGLVTYRIFKSPYVAVKADGRYLSYDFRSNRYWSPNDYRSIAGVLQVGDNFRERLFWQAELKYGRSYEENHSSDLRGLEASATVPINDVIDLVGAYGYGKSGRLDGPFGGNDDFVNYWQRRWYVGISLKKLFSGSDRRSGRNLYYFDESPVANAIVPPGETR